jgi:DNA repair protein RadC
MLPTTSPVSNVFAGSNVISLDLHRRCPLYVHDGIRFREAQEDEIIQAAQQLVTERLSPGSPLPPPAELKDLLRLKLALRHRATFATLSLDYRYRIIDYTELFQGTATGVVVHNREIVRELLHHNAGGVIFARSVPPGVDASYDTYASHYRHLREGLAHIDVCVLDYLIVTDSVISLAERAVADQRGTA